MVAILQFWSGNEPVPTKQVTHPVSSLLCPGPTKFVFRQNRPQTGLELRQSREARSKSAPCTTVGVTRQGAYQAGAWRKVRSHPGEYSSRIRLPTGNWSHFVRSETNGFNAPGRNRIHDEYSPGLDRGRVPRAGDWQRSRLRPLSRAGIGTARRN